MRRRAVALSAAVLLGVTLTACGSDDNGGTIEGGGDATASGPREIDIKAANFAFDPTKVLAAAGEDVQFLISNADSVKHNLTVTGLDIDVDVEPGKTAEAPVINDLKAGTYDYTCEYHPAQMTGSFTVT